MPEQRTICNTSPLLYLHQIDRLNLLKQLYKTVLFPPAVEAELSAGAEQGINVPRLSSYPWLKRVSLVSDASIPLVTDLGRGEAEVIALGLEHPGSRLILDDTLARRIAQLNQLQFTGTVGVIVRAKRVGLVAAVSPIVSQLRKSGLWLSDSLIAEVLRQAGEA
jgi:predicted nucleic acid-binding protein